MAEPTPAPGAPPTREEAELRHALWNIAGTIVAIVDGASDEMRRIAITETSPLVDAARDAITRFGLSNATAPPSLPVAAPPAAPSAPTPSEVVLADICRLAGIRPDDVRAGWPQSVEAALEPMIRQAIHTGAWPLHAAPARPTPEQIAEWGDAVAAIRGCPGAPPAEAVERLIETGDALLTAVTGKDTTP